ncbi:MAG TPA: hypothetical protein PLJ00_15910 [Chitinophagales bacterium]|nr:hypothetical protein [Chitinophagales bacterium]HRG29383.1 hypothetical protein [Chitinophagales bacterium]HRG85203.1 hypothetical protein [Chitinophagales bacterium]HRH52274.1 hypothetical protein [Chitinophagales bacterium]
MESEYYITAFFGLIGTLIGAGISFFANVYQSSKEAKLRVREKIFDKRINTHEEIIAFCQVMRTTVSTHEGDAQNNVITYPMLLINREHYGNFIKNFVQVLGRNSIWMDIELYRYMNYIQDYLESLSSNIRDIEEKSFPLVGVLIKQDFINLALELEKEAFKFFEKDIYNINLKMKKGHHKFPREETVKKFKNTQLNKNIAAIKNIQIK